MKTFLLAAFLFVLTFSSVADTIAIPSRTNLIVRWNTARHPWPKILPTYSIERTIYPMVISNLMVLGSFTETNKTHDDVDMMAFSGSGGFLQIKPLRSEIEFITSRENNAQTKTLGTNQLFHLTTNLVSKLGVSVSEIRKTKDDQPEIVFTEYRAFQTAWFYRSINEMECDSEIGFGRIDFGDQGRPVGITLQWPSINRDKQYATATSQDIIQSIHEGRAIQQPIAKSPSGFETVIDWPTVKSLTISSAKAIYHTGSNRIYPGAWLSGVVDTGKTKLNVEIICPVIDELKPLN
jgi:hypothetical protein